ncbi:putative bifunctional diguanylate cyclase/phosphodiesterase [Clostridium lundense]|uniref:putative bifunctional diguanylate cyclase/phosphodiesterase n=1 Tax=Clostridium lundense TaxID=319475 RepID=UPI0006858C73|nr:bifunctional diguanylate cyclase/phosphodiesterase [Clostridium lundense]
MLNWLKKFKRIIDNYFSCKNILIFTTLGISVFIFILISNFHWISNDFSEINVKRQIEEIILTISLLYSFVFLFFLKSLTELNKLVAKLKEMSFIDELTKLPNRWGFFSIAKKELHVCELSNMPTALLFLDVNKFKQINDNFGHNVGDILLGQISQRFRQYFPNDSILCRLGGDEFIIMLPDYNKNDTENLIIDILHLLSTPYDIENQRISVSFSIGISMYPEDGDTLEKLIKNADSSMYYVKQSSQLVYKFYDEDVKKTITDKETLENDLKNALRNNEFILNYQPILNIKSNKVEGVESLIRWIHPKKGLISPLEFIPLAEETGLINIIGEWVIKTACEQNKKWQKNGYEHVCISVNVSTVQLMQTNFIDTVMRILSETKLDPEYLILEITESTLLNNINKIAKTLKSIQDEKVQIAIDDFGTGYSCLQYLKFLPVNYLKLDGSFIKNIAISDKDKLIISSVINLAHNLNLSVVAEGVEKEHDLEYLKSVNCDKIQGYIIEKPVAPEIIQSKHLISTNNII